MEQLETVSPYDWTYTTEYEGTISVNKVIRCFTNRVIHIYLNLSEDRQDRGGNQYSPLEQKRPNLVLCG